jgi:hypothetical protein
MGKNKTTPKKPAAIFRIPASIVRIVSGLFLAIVIYWLGNSLRRDDLVLADKYGQEAHFHGKAAWILSGSMFCFAIFMVALITIPKHRTAIRCLKYAGCALFVIGIAVGIWIYRNK